MRKPYNHVQSSAHLRSAEKNRFEKSPDVVLVRYKPVIFTPYYAHKTHCCYRRTRRTYVHLIITPIIISCYYYPEVWWCCGPRTFVSGGSSVVVRI